MYHMCDRLSITHVVQLLQTLHNGRRLIYSLAKGGGYMRITFHIGDFTVTIIVKKRESRHSAK